MSDTDVVIPSEFHNLNLMMDAITQFSVNCLGGLAWLERHVTDIETAVSALTETDPVFTAWLATVTPANWNTAYGWGNHAGLYLPIGGGTMDGDIDMDTNEITNLSHLHGASAYLTSGVELGKYIAGGNTAGTMKFWGAGVSVFYTTITAGSQAANCDYTLPTVIAAGLLKSTIAGVMSWDTTAYYKSGDAISCANLTDAGLTITRVPYASTAGLLIDNSAFTFVTATGLLSSTSLTLAGILTLPATSATVGQVKQGTDVILHSMGTLNLFLGAGSGNLSTSGSGQNIGLGCNSLHSITTGSVNMAIGYEAGYDLTTGAANVLVGRGAGRHLIATGNAGGAASYNICIGQNAGYSLTYADRCVAIGNSALYSLQTGNYYGCVAIGASALYSATGYSNVGIGQAAGYLITTGNGYVLIGDNAGRRLTTEGNILVIDNQDRSTHAAELTNCLIYGVFNASPASQTLKFNADVTIATKFGCNTKSAQAAYASGGALSTYGSGSYGFDTAAHAQEIHTLLVNIRAALVANGIMS
jgi:hypothetical protein